MGYVIAAPAQAVVPIDGTTDLFPVHRIYCVGRNYADHAKEMGFSEREPPFFFMKPADAVLPVAFGATGEMPYPGETGNLHHEIELLVAIGRGGRNIAPADAVKHIWGYAVGLDMTRRDLQFALWTGTGTKGTWSSMLSGTKGRELQPPGTSTWLLAT